MPCRITAIALIVASALLPAVVRAQDPQHERHVLRVVTSDGKTTSSQRYVVMDSDGPGTRVLAAPGLAFYSRGFLGVQVLDLTSELRTHFGAPTDRGVLVASVTTNGPARKAGVEVADVLTAIDGSPVSRTLDIPIRLARLDEGTGVALEIWRDHEPQVLHAKIQYRPGPPGGGPGTHLRRRQVVVSEREGGTVRVLDIDPEAIDRTVREFEQKFQRGEIRDRLHAIGADRRALLERIEELETRLRQLEAQLDRLPER